MRGALLLAVTALGASEPIGAQIRAVSDAARPYVTVADSVFAITNVRLMDGTGAPSRVGQTVVVRGSTVVAVGDAGAVSVPAGARSLDYTGHTLIAGFVGLHDHMYYSSVAGSMKLMPYSYPRLFLANGITTIRTTGSVDSYHELNLKRAIEDGRLVGPEVHPTGPYLQGPGPGPSRMHPLSGPEDARRVVRYWAEEGVTWFKAYTQISRAELAAAIDEAHRHGIKVTAHLCSVGFGEAAALGIDNLEHGLLTNTEYWPDKQPDACPIATSAEMYGALDLNSPQVKETIHAMVTGGVALTSTLAVMELSSPSRIPVDERVLDALFPAARTAVLGWFERNGSAADGPERAVLKKAMEFERAFAAAGGVLAAGSDPCCLSVIAGYGDQRNFELLVEAGFSAEEAARVMSLNGATVLGIADRVGSVRPGMQADFFLVRGDPTVSAADIRKVVTVFRQGLGYDSAKLIADVAGQVGIR